jgi:TPR repeat protein
VVNLIEAHKWFNIAAMRGNDDAKRYRLELARDMSKAEILRAQKLAREWLSSVH